MMLCVAPVNVALHRIAADLASLSKHGLGYVTELHAVLICVLLHAQGQANKWVKNMEAQNGLRVLNLAMPDLLRQMENAIQFGNPVLLQVSHAKHTLCPVPTPDSPVIQYFCFNGAVCGMHSGL